MKKIRRTTLTIRTERLVVMSRRHSFYGLCEKCGNEAGMLTVDQAAAMTRVDSLTVYQWIERGMIHVAQTEAGVALICAASLGERKIEEI